MSDQFEMKVWAQMFFDDGSVSEGKRIPATIYEDPIAVLKLAMNFLEDLNRDEGFLLIWGAGDMAYAKFSTSSSKESGSLVSESPSAFLPEHNLPKHLFP